MQIKPNFILTGVLSVAVAFATAGAYAKGGGGGGGGGASSIVAVNASCVPAVSNVVTLQLKRFRTDIRTDASVIDTAPDLTNPWSMSVDYQQYNSAPPYSAGPSATGGPRGLTQNLFSGPGVYDNVEAQWLAGGVAGIPPTPNTDDMTHKFTLTATRGASNTSPAVSCTAVAYFTNQAGATEEGPTLENLQTPSNKPNRAPQLVTDQSFVAANGASDASVILVFDEILNTALPTANQFKLKVTTPANVITTVTPSGVIMSNGDTFTPPIFEGSISLQGVGVIPVGSTVEVTYVRQVFPVPGIPIQDPEGLPAGNFTLPMIAQ